MYHRAVETLDTQPEAGRQAGRQEGSHGDFSLVVSLPATDAMVASWVSSGSVESRFGAYSQMGIFPGLIRIACAGCW